MTDELLAPVRRTLRVVERNLWSSARLWPLFLSGLVEPFLYLLSIGFGVGAFVGPVTGPDGREVPYAVFLAPAILSIAAMNTTVFNTTFVFFHKMKYSGAFHALLSTALDRRDLVRGELAWSLVSSAVYAVVLGTAFAALGLLPSAWSVLTVPIAVLVAFAFAGAGLGLTTFMRSYVDFEYVHIVVTPLFLFSATFVPLSRFPEAVAWAVRLTPLYQGIALERMVVHGRPTVAAIGHVAYLMLMGWCGLRLAYWRLGPILQP